MQVCPAIGFKALSNPSEVGSAAVRHRAFHVLPARVSIQRLRRWHLQILIIYEYLYFKDVQSIQFLGAPCPA